MATTGNIKNVYHGDELEFISTPNAAEKILAHKGTFFGHLNADSLAYGYGTSVTGRVNGHRYIAVITSTDDWTTSPLRGSEPDFYFLKMNDTTYVGINTQSDDSQMRVANFSGRTLSYNRIDFFNYSPVPTIATSDNIENIYQGEELKFTNSPNDGDNIMLSVGEIYLNSPGTSTVNDGYYSTGIGGTRIDSLTKAGGEYILYLYSDDSEWENMSILRSPGSIRSPLYKVGNNIYIGKFTAVGNETGIGISNNIGTGKTLTFSNYTFAEYAPSFATSDNISKVYRGSEMIWEAVNEVLISGTLKGPINYSFGPGQLTNVYYVDFPENTTGNLMEYKAKWTGTNTTRYQWSTGGGGGTGGQNPNARDYSIKSTSPFTRFYVHNATSIEIYRVDRKFRGIEKITENRTITIPFTTEYYNDPTRNEGTYTTTTQGVNGTKIVYEEITFNEGVEVNRVQTNETVISQMTPRRIARGTKPLETLISNPTLYGPVTISYSGTTYTNAYYVTLNPLTVDGGEYRVEFNWPGGTTNMFTSKNDSVLGRSSISTSPYILKVLYSTQVGLNRIYVQRATNIKVYRIK